MKLILINVAVMLAVVVTAGPVRADTPAIEELRSLRASAQTTAVRQVLDRAIANMLERDIAQDLGAIRTALPFLGTVQAQELKAELFDAASRHLAIAEQERRRRGEPAVSAPPTPPSSSPSLVERSAGAGR